jgi:hypothetical protein
MKTSLAAFLLAIALSASVHGAHAQITLENHYLGLFDATPVEIEGEGWKYYGVDTSTMQIRIYNADHSLWRTVTLPIQVYQRNLVVYNVSSKLFDADQDLEFLVNWVDPGPPLTARLAVLSESGVQHQFSSPGTYVPAIPHIFKVNNSWKLEVLSGKIPSTLGHTNLTSIYSLPGTLPASAGRPANGTEGKGMLPYPNPTTDEVGFLLPAPASGEGELIVRDAAGRHVRTVRMARGDKDVTISMADFAPGVYNTELRVDGTVRSISQFVKK